MEEGSKGRVMTGNQGKSTISLNGAVELRQDVPDQTSNGEGGPRGAEGGGGIHKTSIGVDHVIHRGIPQRLVNPGRERHVMTSVPHKAITQTRRIEVGKRDGEEGSELLFEGGRHLGNVLLVGRGGEELRLKGGEKGADGGVWEPEREK